MYGKELLSNSFFMKGDKAWLKIDCIYIGSGYAYEKRDN